MPNENVTVLSLEELQVPKLREQLKKLNAQLADVIEVVTFNEESFEISTEISIRIQQCESLAELDDVIEDVMVARTGDRACLYLFLENTSLVSFKAIRLVSELPDEAASRLGDLKQTLAEPCRQEIYNTYLDGLEQEMGSMALIPASHGDLRGVLAIGDQETSVFKPENGTICLDFLARSVMIAASRLMS